MSELFSDAWMQVIGAAWNNDPKIVEPLKRAKFTANIAYGFINEDNPRGVLVIVDGSIKKAGEYHNEPLDWDLRADKKNWQMWIESGFGLTKLGPAVATKSLRFFQGDYRQMIRNPALSRPFLRHFELMRDIDTNF